jgi:DNA-binding MarR family transcriptional regulator
MRTDLRQLRDALLDLTGVMNSPKPDAALISEAGIALDRALFPLLVRIERNGPIGVVELGEQAGRDYTTVSRQVAKLERLGLVSRKSGSADRRVREAVVTPKGRAMVATLNAAREKLLAPVLAKWSEKDRKELVRLLGKLAQSALEWTRELPDARRP